MRWLPRHICPLQQDLLAAVRGSPGPSVQPGCIRSLYRMKRAEHLCLCSQARRPLRDRACFASYRHPCTQGYYACGGICSDLAPLVYIRATHFLRRVQASQRLSNMEESAALSAVCICRLEKKLSKKPRHLELQDVGLESPSTPVGGPSPVDTPLGGLGPGSRSAHCALLGLPMPSASISVQGSF